LHYLTNAGLTITYGELTPLAVDEVSIIHRATTDYEGQYNVRPLRWLLESITCRTRVNTHMALALHNRKRVDMVFVGRNGMLTLERYARHPSSDAYARREAQRLAARLYKNRHNINAFIATDGSASESEDDITSDWYSTHF